MPFNIENFTLGQKLDPSAGFFFAQNLAPKASFLENISVFHGKSELLVQVSHKNAKKGVFRRHPPNNFELGAIPTNKFLSFLYGFFSQNWYEGVESDFIVREKQYFGPLDPFLQQPLPQFFEMMGHIYLNTWKILSKIDYKTFCMGFLVKIDMRESKVNLLSVKNNILVP